MLISKQNILSNEVNMLNVEVPNLINEVNRLNAEANMLNVAALNLSRDQNRLNDEVKNLNVQVNMLSVQVLNCAHEDIYLNREQIMLSDEINKTIMKKLRQLSLIGLAIALVLTSCTMEKRVYMSGYHIKWNKSKQNPDRQELTSNDNTKQAEQNQTVTVEPLVNETNTVDIPFAPTVNAENITASIDNSIIPITSSSQQDNFSTTNSLEECDNMILKNGEEIKAKVTEITTDEIKYKKCDNLSGPTYSIKKSEVFMIKYPNGTKDIITPNNSTQNNSSQNNSSSSHTDNTHKKTAGLAVVGFIIGLVGFFTPLGLGIVCELLALIFGAVSLAKIKRHPDEYKGKGMAITSLILGLVGLGIVFFLLIATSL